ncbi:MAG: glycine cleavage system protein GcvH [Deferribacterota bacterium]|nr:glycine cleavage system protein GcvH [Deferribacterota bacterium]
MDNFDKLQFLDDLYYSKDHEWLKKVDDYFLLGVTDYAQDQLGDVVYVELPEINKRYKKNEVISTLESVKTVSEVYSPVECTVIEVNEELTDKPELINKDPYNKGFIAKVKIANTKELDDLLDKNQYINLIKGQSQ